MPVTLKWTPDALAHLNAMTDSDTHSALSEGMEGTLIAAESQSRILAPVDTGRLRSSITHETRWEGDTLVGAWGTNVEYAPHIEYGTKAHFPPVAAITTWAMRHGVKDPFALALAIARHGVKAHPFLQPVLDAPFLLTIYTKQMFDAVTRLWGKISGD